jgi:AsmA family/AsmA-like C-terminal region
VIDSARRFRRRKRSRARGDVVQTTLLGFAIALILVLVTALVGPLLVDWNAYRAEFDSHATRLAGREVHVRGRIEARLLPTPTLVLHGVELGEQNQKIRAGVLRLELALGALARGELRISDAAIEQPELTLTLDEFGRVDWAAPRPNFNPEGVSIERLRLQGGRVTLLHQASGSRLLLEKLEFRGELRSLMGPLKGDGSFIAAGQHYPYRISANRLGENGGVKLRLAVDPVDRPLTAEVDISVSVDRDIPRFEGTLQVARLVGRASAGEQIVEPWRLNAHLKGDGLNADLDQLEFQYGPEERAAKLKGTARMGLGREPRISGNLTSAQMDLDRALAMSGANPIAAVKSLANVLNAWPRMAVPVNLSIGVDALMMGGAAMQRLAAEVEVDAETIALRALEFRAPGVTQVRLNGHLRLQPGRVGFSGGASVEANDARTFLGWATGYSDAQIAGPLRFDGKVALSEDQLTIDDMKLEFERMSAAGRLLYAAAGLDRPPRLEAALTAPEIDLDRLQVLAKAVLGDGSFDFPREGKLSLSVGRATFAGIEARQSDVKARIDSHGIDIEQLSIRDFGGATLAIKGRIDTDLAPPRGTMAIDLDAQSLDGLLSVLEKFAPQKAQQVRRLAPRVLPLALRTTLTVDPGAAGAAFAGAKVKLDALGGRSFRLALIGDVSASADAFRRDKLSALEAAKINVIGRIDAEDSQALIQALFLDRFIAAEIRPGRVTLAAKGALDQALDVNAQLTSGVLTAAAQGTLRLSNGLTHGLDLRFDIKNANLWSPRKGASGHPADAWPATVSGRLEYDSDTLRLQELNGTVASVKLGGGVTLGLQNPMHIDGDIELSSFDLPAGVMSAVGLPPRAATAGQNIGSDLFEPVFGGLSGRIRLNAQRVILAPKLDAREFKGAVHFGNSQVALQANEGTVAGGAMRGELIFLRSSEGLIGRVAVKVTGAQAAELLPGDGSISGRLNAELSAEGNGMSAGALLGSLQGQGIFTLENGSLARLNPGAFATVIRAVDQGLAIDPVRLRDRMDAALSSGPLTVPLVQGSIVIEAGQARLKNSAAGADGTEIATTATLDMAEGLLDARLAFTGPETTAFANTRPEILVLVKGPVDAARRTIDAAQFASWLALRSVEQQSKTLDMMEGRDTPIGATASPAPAPAVRSGLTAPKPAASAAEPTPVRPKPRPRSAAQKPKPAEEGVPTARTVPPPRSLSEFFFGGMR